MIPSQLKCRASTRLATNETPWKKAHVKPLPTKDHAADEHLPPLPLKELVFPPAPKEPLSTEDHAPNDSLPQLPLAELVFPLALKTHRQCANASAKQPAGSVTSNLTITSVVESNCTWGSYLPPEPLTALKIPTEPNMQWHAAYQMPKNSLRNSVSDILAVHVKITDDHMGIWDSGPRSPVETHQDPPAIATGHQGPPCALSTKVPPRTVIADGDIPDQPLIALVIPDGPRIYHAANNEGAGPSDITWQSGLMQTDFTARNFIFGRMPTRLTADHNSALAGSSQRGMCKRNI